MHLDRQRIIGIAFVFGSLLGGCTGGPWQDEAPVDVQSAVKDGILDDTSTAVLGISSDRPDGYHLCTGTLILPNLVLTARHCVADAPANTACATSMIGAPADVSKITLTTTSLVDFVSLELHAESVWVPEGTAFCGADHALIVLPAPIDAKVAKPIVPRVDLAAAQGETFAAVGFGVTNNAGDGLATRHRGDGFTVKCTGLACASSNVTATEWSSLSGPCQGDSGGPALDTAGRVFGVVSRGTGACSVPILGDVSAFGDWLRDRAIEAAALTGSTPPPWALGWPTDPAFSAPIGATCASSADCAPGTCLDAICTRPCNDAAPCPEGLICEPRDAASYCVAKPLPPTPDGGGQGGDGGGSAVATGGAAAHGFEAASDTGCSQSRLANSPVATTTWWLIAAALGLLRRARRASA